MKYSAEDVYYESLKQLTGMDGREALGGTSIEQVIPDSLSEESAVIFKAAATSTELPAGDKKTEALRRLCLDAERIFSDYYSKKEDSDSFQSKAAIIFNSEDPLERARAVTELWSPELLVDDDEIFSSWKLASVKPNPAPYNPSEILIQLNALYSPAGDTLPSGISSKLSDAYAGFIRSNPEKIAVYDHPVPIFTRGAGHELENCLVELDADIAYEKECGVFPPDKKLNVLISISTTHRGLDTVCGIWLKEVFAELDIKHLNCYLLSESKARELDQLLGSSTEIFTVQGKYACHFGALKYAQLIFEKSCGTRAGFKLDTDEGIHSRDMKQASGKTWLEQLCHPYWGGTAENSAGEPVTLGFNIGEYVDSRDLDSLGYAEAIRTPEVKRSDDLRGPYLLFNKGVCQAKGTALLNRTEKLDDFISHPLVKGGGYGVDNQSLRKAAPVGFSMVGRAEDQQFYFSAINSGVQGIFNPLLRIIHYKASVAGSEHKHEAGRNIADIYRMLLFKELMSHLYVVEKTRPFPANYASQLSAAQVPLLWCYLVFKSSAAGDEATAEEYLAEGRRQLLPLYDEIAEGRVTERFEHERSAWKEFISAVDEMKQEDAADWIDSLKL